MNKKKIVVIGGGPAGMLAASTAASRGYSVTLLERNDKLGKKLYITGKGRCNLTNAIPVEDIFSNIPRNSKFLYSALYSFTNEDLIKLFHSLGLATKVERGNRVFPASEKASDVTKALTQYMQDMGVNVILHTRAQRIIMESQHVSGVLTEDGRRFDCQSLILSTGGMSYPSTGSTGDGYKMAQELGHTLIAPKPSLIPLNIKETWVKRLQELSLKNVSLSAMLRKKVIFHETGEMLFTHFGISGPLVLSLSSHILDKDFSKLQLILDLKPVLDEDKLDKRLLRDFEKFSRKQYKNALEDLLPQKMIPEIIELTQISPEKPVHQISKEERRKLAYLLKNLILTVESLRPINEAIVTRGGISTQEIDPSTMESKMVKGLFFAGELIDVDAYTGGFNLQIAFSTGYVSGNSC